MVKKFFILNSKEDNSAYLGYGENEDEVKLKLYNQKIAGEFSIDTKYNLISDDVKRYIIESCYDIDEISEDELAESMGYDYIICCIESDNIYCLSEPDDIEETSETFNDLLNNLADRVCLFDYVLKNKEWYYYNELKEKR